MVTLKMKRNEKLLNKKIPNKKSGTTKNPRSKQKNTTKRKRRTTRETKKTQHTTQILYLYDVKCKVKDYNRLKRVFYYRFNKLGVGKLAWKSKSALLVPLYMENLADNFFHGFKGCVEVYKVELISITRLH